MCNTEKAGVCGEPAAVNVLVINDDESMNWMLREMILDAYKVKGHGVLVKIKCALTYKDALQVMDGWRVDILFTELDLRDDFDGFDLMKKTREAHPTARLFMITGIPKCDLMDRLSKVGGSDILELPVNVSDFVGLI